MDRVGAERFRPRRSPRAQPNHRALCISQGVRREEFRPGGKPKKPGAARVAAAAAAAAGAVASWGGEGKAGEGVDPSDGPSLWWRR